MILITVISLMVLTLWFVLARTRPRVAILTLPLAVVMILAAGVFADTREYDVLGFHVIAAIGWAALTVVSTLLVLATTPYDFVTGQYPWPRTWAKWILIFLGYLLLLVILLAVFNLFGIIFFALFLSGAFRFQKTVRYAGAMEILSTLSHSVRQSLPLPMALHTAAQNRPNSASARVLESISHWLVQGLPLGQAIRNGWPKAPTEIVTSIEAAERISQLPQMLESLERDATDKADDYKKVRPVHPFYPLVVATMAFLVMLGLFIFILPTFAEILSDTSDGEVGLPGPTQFLLDIANFMTSNKGLPALLIFIGLILLSQVSLLLSRKRRRPGTTLTSLSDAIKWRLPLQGWFERNYSQLLLVEYLRAAFRAGLPVNEALRDALVLDLNSVYKQRVRRWIDKIENGVSLSDAARRAGMGPTLAWAFDEGLNRQNLPELLAMIEETTRGNYDYRANILRSILWPVVIVLLGMIIGFFVYAFFLPMVQMIYITMEYSMP